MKAAERYFIDGVSCVLSGRVMPVANLSVGGLFAATGDEPPMLGQLVALELSLKGRASFPLLGKVTWINDPARPKAPDLPQGFGIKITKIAFPDKLAILDLLKRSAENAKRVRGEPD